MSTDQYLKTALQAAKDFGKIFKADFGKPSRVSIKNGNPRDLVTEIDLKIETDFRRLIAKKYPDHLVIGEEFGPPDKSVKDKLVWIIDPVDGTTNFVRGIPFCCISIGLWDQAGPLMGVVYNPIADRLYSAQRGCGAFLNNEKIAASNSAKLSEAFGGIGWGRDAILGSKILPPLLKETSKARTFGSAALEICAVADGTFDYYIHGKLNIWDAAAAILIVQEAGGKASDWQGKELTLQMKNLIASNPVLFDDLLEKIKMVKI